VVLNGRYAGKKAVIVKNYDEGTSSRPYGHALVCGLSTYPRKVRERSADVFFSRARDDDGWRRNARASPRRKTARLASRARASILLSTRALATRARPTIATSPRAVASSRASRAVRPSSPRERPTRNPSSAAFISFHFVRSRVPSFVF
jgi:hypothetical protein